MDLINTLNNSKYFSGLIMVLLNLGSKYVSLEISEAQDFFLSEQIFLHFYPFCNPTFNQFVAVSKVRS